MKTPTKKECMYCGLSNRTLKEHPEAICNRGMIHRLVDSVPPLCAICNGKDPDCKFNEEEK